MIRTTGEAPFFDLWHDAPTLAALVRTEYLTTARYEPALRRLHGVGHIDLLFEYGPRSCVIGGIRLDPNHLLIRHRSPIIWPQRSAALVAQERLVEIEAAIVPWLRSLARAHHMAVESIRRFVPSERFERARAAEFVGAALLDVSMLRMAPFVYARRFATGARVRIDCPDGALAAAVLADTAAAIEYRAGASSDETFAQAWYGVTPSSAQSAARPDVLIVARDAEFDAAIVIETDPAQNGGAAIVDVPAPVPWDLLFSYDAADAPPVARFGVRAVEPSLRAVLPPPAVHVHGGSSGTVVLALNSEMAAMQGPDAEEVRVFAQRLTAEGFRVHLSGDASEPAVANAALIHIFGSPYEYHTIAFAETARGRGIPFVFDVAPLPAAPSLFSEVTLYLVYISSIDNADLARYLDAFERGSLDAPADPNSPPEPEPAEYERLRARFCELTADATAILTHEDDLDVVRALVPPRAAERVAARALFGEPETAPRAIGHVVPHGPFALVHAPIARRANALYAAVAAERFGIPLVIAGPVYEVDYLQALRTYAPSAIVLADADPGTVSALYRRAAVWIDGTRRPRTAASLIRAIDCGALPLLTTESPLVRITRDGVPTFALAAIDECGRTIAAAMAAPDRDARVARLRARLPSQRDSAAAFTTVVTAYSRAAAPV